LNGGTPKEYAEIAAGLWTAMILVTWPVWDKDTDQYLYVADPLQVKTGYSKIAQPENDK
jgi:hypothetical protein